MSQDLALLLIKNKRAKNLDFKKVVQQFASAKQDEKLQVFNHRQVNQGSLLNYLFLFPLYIYPTDSQESDGGANT